MRTPSIPGTLTEEHRAVLDRFPSALRTMVENELAAGNSIIDAGAGHPAPPAGGVIKLAHDLITMKKDSGDGLHIHQRNSSTHNQELTDDQRFYWILTAALPPPPAPDMNAIRAAREYQPAPVVKKTFPHGTVEMDHRGEMLILHERDRRTDIVWTWNHGNRLYRSSLSPWWYPAEHRSQAMTDEERDLVLERFMEYGRACIGRNIEWVD